MCVWEILIDIFKGFSWSKNNWPSIESSLNITKLATDDGVNNIPGSNANSIEKNESLLNFGHNNLKSLICEYNLSPNGDLKEASKNFFNYLHLIDKSKSTGIAVAPIPNHGLGKTINDRLIRASS